jgi:hypothetical protein
MPIDRSEISRCVAKAIAYINVNKRDDARAWVIQLVKLLGFNEILK